MKRLAVVFLVVMMFGIALVGHAQVQDAAQSPSSLSAADTKSEWSLILEPFLTEGFLRSWKVSVDSYVGGTYLYPAERPLDRNLLRLQYRQAPSGAGLRLKMRPTIFAEALYRPNGKLGVGLSGSAFAARGSDGSDSSGSGGDFLRFVENELGTTSIEFFGWKTAKRTANEKFDLLGGLKVAQVTVRCHEGEEAAPYMYNFYRPDQSFYGRIVTERVASVKETYITGPFVGVRLASRVGQFNFTGILKQSVLFGTKSQLVNFVQDGHKVETAVRFPCFVGLSTESFVGCDANVLVPVTELRLKISRKIGDTFSMGAGIYASLWFNVPGAPIFPAEGTCENNPCTGIIPPSKARIFLAGLFSIKW